MTQEWAQTEDTVVRHTGYGMWDAGIAEKVSGAVRSQVQSIAKKGVYSEVRRLVGTPIKWAVIRRAVKETGTMSHGRNERTPGIFSDNLGTDLRFLLQRDLPHRIKNHAFHKTQVPWNTPMTEITNVVYLALVEDMYNE